MFVLLKTFPHLSSYFLIISSWITWVGSQQSLNWQVLSLPRKDTICLPKSLGIWKQVITCYSKSWKCWIREGVLSGWIGENLLTWMYTLVIWNWTCCQGYLELSLICCWNSFMMDTVRATANGRETKRQKKPHRCGCGDVIMDLICEGRRFITWLCFPGVTQGHFLC